ncbi:MAG: DUF6057 family protein [Tannerellaceae bacterium]|jgi:hypothetical protein|nr:DUF6057 family protein [Tannerellaceae bacterium]
MKKFFGRITVAPLLITAFALYAIWLWQMQNPELYLMRRYPAFFTGVWFAENYFDFPGYPSEYLARFITQLYRFPLLASVLVALILSAIYRLGTALFAGRAYSHAVGYVSVVGLMMMHSDYWHDLRFDLLVLLVFSALCLLSASFNKLRRIPLCIACAVLSGGVLYAGGLLPSALFIIMASMMLAARPKAAWPEWTGGLLIVALAFGIRFALSVHDVKQEAVDMMRIYPFAAFPFVLYGAILAAGILALTGRGLRTKLRIRPLYLASAMLAVPCIFLLLSSVVNREEKQSLTVQHYALSCRWEETLEAARLCKHPDRNTAFYTNEALYRTGKIHSDLFLYNQSFGSAGLMLPEENTLAEILPNQHIYLYLGAISLSVKWGREAANVYGMNPFVMLNLIKAYLAGGYIPEAHKILNLLEHAPFEAEAARYYRRLALDTSLIRQDRELAEIRSALTPVTVVARQNPVMNLPFLAQFPGLNRMAYDYLLLAALLDNQTERFAYYVTKLKDFGYGNIPKLYLEGLIYLSLYRDNPLDMDMYGFDMNTVYRFRDFQNELLAVASRNPSEASGILKQKYGDTYWYYLLFQSPLSDENKKEVFFRMTQ